MAQLYSEPLSAEAKEKLIEFLGAYLESLKATEVDERAKIAKQKAIACLQTDIDILAFVTTLWIMPQATFLIQRAMEGIMSSRQVAEQIVEITDKARSVDRSWRPGGRP